MKKTISILIGTALVLASCSHEQQRDTAFDRRGQEIRLSSEMAAAASAPDGATRSFDLPNLRSDLKCYVWADQLNPTGSGETFESEAWFGGWELRTGNNQLVPWTAGDVRSYPTENAVNLYAVVGNFADDLKGSDLPDIVGVLHSVSDNQTRAQNYYESDLVYASLLYQFPTSETVSMHFYHLLSKVQVQLVPGDDMTTAELQSAKVTLLGVRRNVLFKPVREAWLEFPDEREMLLAEPLQADVDDGNILVGTGLTDYEDCVLPPQTLSDGVNLIQVKYSDETVYYRLDEPLTLVGGQCYRFQLTVDKVKKIQTVTPTLTPWDETTAKTDVNLDYLHDWGDVVIDAIPNQPYTGEAIEPELTVHYIDERILERDVDYSVEYSNNTAAGTAYATVTGLRSFEGGSQRVAFTIGKATPDITLDDSQMELVRTEKQTRTATATAGINDIPSGYITYASDNPGVATVNETTGEVTATGPGTATITATVSVGDNWASTAKTYTVKVTTLDMAQADLSPIADVTYTGAAHEPSLTVAYNGTRLTKGTDYAVSYADNTNAGTATVTVTGMGRYGGTKQQTFTIKKATPVITMSATQMTVNVGSTQTRTATAKAGVTQIPASYITYTSASTATATVNASSGLVTGVAEGTTTITATIAEGQNWTSVQKLYVVEVKGEPTTLAELKDWINSGNSWAPYYGLYVTSSGALTTSSSGAIGIVAAMSSSMTADLDKSGSHILVLALNDANGGEAAQWSTATATNGEWGYGDGFNGLAFLQRIKSLGQYESHPAAYWANKYSASRPSGASEWFLPTYRQWVAMLTYGKAVLPKYRNYWTATLYSNNMGVYYLYDTYSGGDSWNIDYTNNKTDANYVRACFAY